MNWLTKKIASLEAQAQTHEESVAWHLEAARDARDWARAYRGLHEALEADDVAAAREYASMVGVELRLTRDGAMECVVDELVDVDAVAVVKRGA